MAVGARELMLILRARDEASRVLGGLAGKIDGTASASQKAAQKHMEQGKALVGIGAGIATVGGIALGWLNQSTNAAGEYNTQVRYTATQTDKVKVSLEKLSDIGLDLARTIPVPFEEIQGGLYDIFSSMDVTVPQAKNLLTEFSKAAVAGQTDLQTAGRGTIAIMNAWKMPATEVNRVNDVMFRLVQKGVGTYEGFSKAIGRAIPSTVRAGGSIEDLAGMMAFMTRNGLSTAQAATSAGRAFDAMSNPATEKHMKAIGLSVRDAKGEFKPMKQVVEELNGKLGKMTAPERAKAMKELFLGSGGTIQARRFFDLAIPGFKELNDRTKEMHDSAGTMEGAYKTMFDSPQAKMQLMTNKYMAMRVEIGNQLLPIKMKLVEIIGKVLDAWNNLSPQAQKFIAITALIVVGITILVGVLLIVVGGILMLMGAAALAGVAIGSVVAAVVAVIVIIGLLIFAAWQIVTDWDTISQFFKDVWNQMVQNVKDSTSDIWNTIKDWVNTVKQFFVDVWNGIRIVFMNAFNGMLIFWVLLPGRFMNGIAALRTLMANFWNNLVAAVRERLTNGFNAMILWMANMAIRIMAAVASVRNNMIVWMANVATGARNAMVTGFNNIIAWFQKLPGRIRGAIPGPGSILSGIGRAIMGGLISGVQSQIGRLQDMFGSITNMIPDWKGPASVDRKLLYGAGQMTLQGYGEGIEARLPWLKNKLQGITRKIPTMAGSGPGTQTGAPSGVTQYFTINTQEIDPRKHSADLGMMLASRLG